MLDHAEWVKKQLLNVPRRRRVESRRRSRRGRKISGGDLWNLLFDSALAFSHELNDRSIMNDTPAFACSQNYGRRSQLRKTITKNLHSGVFHVLVVGWNDEILPPSIGMMKFKTYILVWNILKFNLKKLCKN